MRGLPCWYRAGWVVVPRDLHGTGGGMMKGAEAINKTRQDVFLEQWPEAELVDGIIGILPCHLVTTFWLDPECRKTFCPDCRRKFWMQEVE